MCCANKTNLTTHHSLLCGTSRDNADPKKIQLEGDERRGEEQWEKNTEMDIGKLFWELWSLGIHILEERSRQTTAKKKHPWDFNQKPNTISRCLPGFRPIGMTGYPLSDGGGQPQDSNNGLHQTPIFDQGDRPRGGSLKITPPPLFGRTQGQGTSGQSGKGDKYSCNPFDWLIKEQRCMGNIEAYRKDRERKRTDMEVRG